MLRQQARASDHANRRVAQGHTSFGTQKPMAGLERIDVRGMPALRVRAADGASLVMLHQGAHIVSWVPTDGDECIYVSDRSAFSPGAAVRGGVPVVFPQFATYGPLPHHGLLRTRAWDLVDGDVDDERTRVVFRSTDSEETRGLWPHQFVVQLAVEVRGHELEIVLDVQNRGDTPMPFTAALHTYLR